MRINKQFGVQFSFACFIIMLTFCSCKKEALITTSDETPDLLFAINSLRASGCKCGTDTMPPVKILAANKKLTAAAMLYAKDMNTRGFFSHISPEGTSPIQRAIKEGYTGSSAGENIARDYSSTNEVMHAWILSPEHCKAMMDTIYNEMGAGRSGNYWVADFGKQ